MRKPDAEIFEFVLNENKLDPTKTLFIDDTEQHILGAKKLGVQTYHLGKEEGICDILK
jgi:putative hydrolase of the HAD superfamily